ncbi:hypothetical protein EVAR_44788_1 [Eumeta japonica]|uniref:Uncharacterized protein n=1 Tax=Eumeta variegata TaxID=151549 RepID=A0A4C1Y7G9_EUMVA|nr:hypothetical protein EVAR_44788_1 [Eumeta japonica]
MVNDSGTGIRMSLRWGLDDESIYKGNEQANHQRADGHLRPRTLATLGSHRCVTGLLGGNRISNEKRLG